MKKRKSKIVTPAELSELKKVSESLHLLGSDILHTKLSHSQEDHFGFMCVSFCWRQLEHLKSLYVLMNNECYQDMLIVSRTMLEGMAILHGGYLNQEEVPLRWRSFAWVADYRMAMDQTKQGESIDEKTKKSFEAGLDKYGRLFLKKDRKLNLNFKEDPFVIPWFIGPDGKKVTLEMLFEKMKGKEYFTVYQDMSDWIHWNIRGFGSITERNGNEYVFEYKNLQNAAYAMVNGIIACSLCFKILDWHMKLNSLERFKAIEDQLISFCSVSEKN